MLLFATVAAAESIGCCPPVRTGQNPAARTAAPCLSCRPLLSATFAAAESVGCCPPVRTGQNPVNQTRRLCSRRIRRVLPTSSDGTNPSCSNVPPTCSTVCSYPLPLQPQNLSGAAHLLDCLLLPATVAGAESVGCRPPARTGQNPVAHTAAPRRYF